MASRAAPLFYFMAGAAVCGVCSIIYFVSGTTDAMSKIQTSPLSNSTSDDKLIPYPPTNYIPGARDISTPLGSMRIYEFGPEDAERKVLLIHGISTPCVSLAVIAENLSKRGCRVMMFDLFGRGWSDAPPGPYNEALYTTQIFMALASSPISWTGNDNISQGFSIIGYSMGGGVAANFTSHFPYLIDDLVLLAPGGILRPRHPSWQTRLLYSGLIPESFVSKAVWRRLTANSSNVTKITSNTATQAQSEDIVSAETISADMTPRAFSRSIDAEAVLKWQMVSHPGFVHAVLSSYHHAPIYGQHHLWRAIGKRLNVQRAAKSGAFPDPGAVSQGLRTGKVLMVLASRDDAICTPELLVDAREVLGEGNLEILELDCGHDAPMTHGKEIVDFIWRHWEGTE